MSDMGRVSGHTQLPEPGHGPTPGYVAEIPGVTVRDGDTRPLPPAPLGTETRPAVRDLTYTVRDMTGPDREYNSGEHAFIAMPEHEPDGRHTAPDGVRAPTNRTPPGSWDDTLPRH